MLQIFTIIGNSSDNIIIAHFIDPAAVANYEIVRKLFLLTMFTQFLIQPLWPAFGEALSSGDYRWAKTTLQRAIILGVISSAFFSLPLLFGGKFIINLWVGATYVPSFKLLIAFYLFSIFASYGGVMSTFLNSGELIKKQLIILGLASTCATILKIVFSINYGLSGVIWATLLAYSVFYIYPVYKISFHYLKVKNHETD